MNNQIKVLLTIQGIPGGIIKPIKKEKRKWVFTKGNIPNYKGKDKNAVINKGTYIHTVYEEVPCSQSINLTYDAYNYMTSEEKPEWFKGPWKQMKKEQRLNAHLNRICESLNGKSYSYHVLED